MGAGHLQRSLPEALPGSDVSAGAWRVGEEEAVAPTESAESFSGAWRPRQLVCGGTDAGQEALAGRGVQLCHTEQHL